LSRAYSPRWNGTESCVVSGKALAAGDFVTELQRSLRRDVDRRSTGG